MILSCPEVNLRRRTYEAPVTDETFLTLTKMNTVLVACIATVRADAGLVDHPIESGGSRVYLDGAWELTSPALQQHNPIEATV